MARNVADLAMLLAVQAGYDARVPLSMQVDTAVFRGRLERDFTGTRIAWVGDCSASIPYAPGVLDLCRAALKNFEAIGCVVEEAQPDYSVDAVWSAWLTLRAWQSGSALLAFYNDPAKRALMKPEAIFEVERGLKLTAYWWMAIPVVICGTLAFMSIGLLVGALAKTQEAATALVNLIVLPMAFLGGAFPFEVDISVAAILATRLVADRARRARVLELLEVDPAWRMHRVSDGQRRRVQRESTSARR